MAVPLKVYDEAVVQMVASAPAFTVGAGVMVKVIAWLTEVGEQVFPLSGLLNALRVRVTEPAVISAALGV